jgi:hypothetical protein
MDARDRVGMGPMLVNTKQKIAVLATGLVVASSGLVTEEAVANRPPPHIAPVSHQAPAAGERQAPAVPMDHHDGEA